jgi:hypothetical protein
MPDLKDILAAFAALVASFAGAWAAFALESRRRRNEEDERSVGSANRAIYTVYHQWNVLEQYRKEVMEPYRGKPDAWLNLAANPCTSEGDYKFDAAQLQFLLQLEKTDAYVSLMLEEQRFKLAIDLIKTRSELVLNEVFPMMAAAGINIGQPMFQQNVEQVLGIDVTRKLKELTAAIYKNVDENLASLRTAHDVVRSTMKSLYPKKKFIEVQFQENAHDERVQ